jgi:hypothetical protein
MIITDKYIKWFKNTDEDSQGSVFNHVIYTLSSMKLKERFKIAGEII